jgi:hypothetical protein
MVAIAAMNPGFIVSVSARMSPGVPAAAANRITKM